MSEKTTIHLYIPTELREPLNKAVEKTGLSTGAYINQKIREKLSEEGFL